MTNKQDMPSDPIERIVYESLEGAIMDGTPGMHGATKHLDFYLPEHDIYIECCAAYTPRKIEQASRAENVIIIQGKKAAEYFAHRHDRRVTELLTHIHDLVESRRALKSRLAKYEDQDGNPRAEAGQ